MKKILSFLLKPARRSFGVAQLRAGRIIAKRLRKWVAAKGYTAPGLSVNDVAASFDVTHEQLSYYCSRHLGKSFSNLRTQLRMEEAKRLLLSNPSMPLCRIGEAVGIHNKSNFRVQFKAYTGMTPFEYREKHSR